MQKNLIKKQFREDIESIEVQSETELAYKNEILTWIDEADTLFRTSKNPDTPNKHACFFGIVVDKRSGIPKILLLEHKKSGLLLPSGGHLDADESPYECVKREMFEELGITEVDATFSQKPVYVSTLDTSNSGFHIELWHLIYVEKDLDFTEGKDYSAEFSSHDWYTIEQLKAIKRTTPTMPGFIEKVESRGL